jgi:hypothetical protein
MPEQTPGPRLPPGFRSAAVTPAAAGRTTSRWRSALTVADVLCGAPEGGPEEFFRRAFDAGRDDDPEHASHHWTFEVSPLLDRAYLERQRQRV